MNLDIFQFKSNLLDFVTNRILICAVITWILSQILKVLTTTGFRKNFTMKRLLVGNGGMPSSHSAVVCATAFSCGIIYGYDTPWFAIAVVLAGIVMCDAAGIRRAVGKQAEAINQMTREPEKKRKNGEKITLSEMVGHTPVQVLVGALLGVAMAFFCQYWLFNKFLPAI